MAASTPHHSKDKLNGDVYQCVSVVTAASICLKNRSMRMTVVQLMISLIINHSSYTVSCFFTLNTVRKVTQPLSYTHVCYILYVVFTH